MGTSVSFDLDVTKPFIGRTCGELTCNDIECDDLTVNDNVEKTNKINLVKTLSDFQQFAYCKLEQGVKTFMLWSNEISDYINNKNIPADVTSMFGEKAYIILISAGSVTAAYIVFKNAWSIFRKKRKKSKDEGEMKKLREEIDEHLRVINSSPTDIQNLNDKRALCILCLHNHRECVFLDCGHICVCVDCLKSLPFPKTCPICRCKIIQTILLLHE